MSTLKCPDEVLHFPNHMSIEINYRNAITYYKCKQYDEKVMNQGFIWHQIVVQHYGKLMGIEGKYAILEAIFAAVEGEEFYPVAYRRGNKEDRFLVRQCQPAMDKLFARNLCLHLPKGVVIHLKVQLNVGEFKYGQVSPISQVTKALNALYGRMEHRNGEDGILNLSLFAQNPEFYDVVVNLSNRGVLERVCDLIYRNDEQFRTINGIILSSNEINTLAPLKLFSGVQFAILDLSDNLLRSPSRTCRDLEPLKADELMLQGNPLTKAVTYPECLRPVLKNFKKIDGIPSENLSSDYTPLDNLMQTESEGYRIDWSNKTDINKFENSTDWHAFMIPDEKHQFSKEEIFDYFFLTISNNLSDIYPCYYKFNSGEHQFLVRNCFSQIKHLVDTCNLEIKIPRLEAPPPPTNTTTDFTPQLHMDKTVVYYLMMNISPFKKGQLEPMECIEKALNRRFSAMDRMLDLNNFQNIEGLENIVINLSSPKILTRVLMQASRKFLSTCIELRLAHNKILSANFSKVLAMMSNLKAIDLGNNWIHDLYDIKDIGVLGIRSLRLDGNPLCSKYCFAGEYIKTVKKYFPDLKVLDNVEITAKGNLTSQKNFLCDTAGYDFVNEFVTRYFQTYENDRVYLKDLYHPKSVLTLTCNYNLAKLPAQNSKRILKYLNVSRNILKIEFNRAYTSMYFGPSEIIRVLMELPGTTHDMLTFSTDCMVYNENMIVITVNGVYLDQAPSIMETDILMGFSRTFILKPVKRNAGPLKMITNYQIINDQLNVFTPTATQTKIAFKYFKSEDKSKKDELTLNDKEALLVMFQEATSLKSIWCTRCLDEANWNFENALEIFLQLSEKKEIPDTAFN
ncbi:Nuclear RNA export factor 2 [Lucilia cuprina]|uniref:Nuclear RNA export factor 2 n=1 Tax=Lucilia cuprina TaxID=7375 RepID=A0A0L0C220_LUCCU|nr:Nuclear RNA export factor 2 [Lucilia cuprina]